MRGDEVYRANEWVTRDDRFGDLAPVARVVYTLCFRHLDDAGVLSAGEFAAVQAVVQGLPEYAAVEQHLAAAAQVGLVQRQEDGSWLFVDFVVPQEEHVVSDEFKDEVGGPYVERLH